MTELGIVLGFKRQHWGFLTPSVAQVGGSLSSWDSGARAQSARAPVHPSTSDEPCPGLQGALAPGPLPVHWQPGVGERGPGVPCGRQGVMAHKVWLRPGVTGRLGRGPAGPHCTLTYPVLPPSCCPGHREGITAL